MKNKQSLKRVLLIISSLAICLLTVPGYGVTWNGITQRPSLVVTYTNETGDNLIYTNMTCNRGQAIDFPQNIQNKESTTASFEPWRGIGWFGPDCTVTFTDKSFNKLSIRTSIGFASPSNPHADLVEGTYFKFIKTASQPSGSQCSSTEEEKEKCWTIPGKLDLKIIKE